MDVRALRYFIAVAEEGSIHAGARRVMVAQPAVSQALRRLEREVGGPVFHRSHRGVELTPAGESLLEHARFIVGYLADAAEQVRATACGARTVLRLGLVEGRVAAAELTGSIVAAFRREHPGVRLEVRELSFVSQSEALLDDTVDVTLARLPYSDERLDTVGLFSEPLVLAVSATNPVARLPEIDLGDLLARPMLEMVHTPRAWRDFWHLTQLRNEPSRAVPSTAVSLFDVQFELLSCDGLAAVSASAWRMSLRDSALATVPIRDAPRNTIGVGFRRQETRPEVHAFARTARRITREMIALVPGGELVAAS